MMDNKSEDERQNFIDDLANAMREVGLPVETTRDSVYINVSAVKARKDEALRLLSLEKPTLEDLYHLDKLTAEQTGVDLRLQPDWFEYHCSIDACMTLPLPENHFWRLWGKMSDTPIDNYHAEIREAVTRGEDSSNTSPDRLSLAMLKAWWKIQP